MWHLTFQHTVLSRKLHRVLLGARFYEQGTRTAVAVKKMPKDWRKTHDNMLWKEALALKAACGVPRVVKFFGSAYAPRMECLVLE